MCGKLDSYLEAFSTLRTNINRKRWPDTTRHRAPHKTFLLLSVFDLIATGCITRNFIAPSFELAETFTGYWQKVMPVGTSASMATPFYNLHTSTFWSLVKQPGYTHGNNRIVSSVKRLHELYLGARFADDLYPLLVMESSRQKLRQVLIQTCFSAEVQRKWDLFSVNPAEIQLKGSDQRWE